MTGEEAAQVLRVALPITSNALKTAFRRRASEEHPDKSKHPRAAERFVEVQAAFEFLDGSEYVVGAPPEARCDDGTLLTMCGLGLGPTINGKPCPECRGRGYREIYERERCPDCRPMGLFYFRYEYRCRKCAGTGRFLRNGKDVGICFACNGFGWHRDHDPSAFGDRCGTCRGTRYASTRQVASYMKCHACDGTGEIKVLNPVLPKGLFTGKGEGR